MARGGEEMGFGSPCRAGTLPKQRAASRWHGLPIIAASAVAPLIVLHVGTHLSGEEVSEARALSIGVWPLWAVLALPPIAATVAGLVVFRPPRARSLLALLGGLVVYPLSTGFLFIVVMHGFSAANRLEGPLAVLVRALAAIPWGATLLSALAAGAVVGLTAVGGICGLFRSPRPGRELWVRRRADGSDGLYVERARPPGERLRWLGAVAGIAGIVLPMWFSKLPDILSALPLLFLFPGAWLSAVCVVLILRPRAPATLSGGPL